MGALGDLVETNNRTVVNVTGKRDGRKARRIPGQENVSFRSRAQSRTSAAGGTRIAACRGTRESASKATAVDHVPRTRERTPA